MAVTGKWSTALVNTILDEYNRTGKMPKNNPFYEGKPEWRDANLNYSYTKAEFVEMAKCQQDILHYAETKCKVMTDDGIRMVKLRPYQQKVLLQYKKYRFNVFLASRQIGKCVTFDTIVEIVNPRTGQFERIPIFELHYRYKRNKRIIDYIEWGLYKLLAQIKKRIN